MGLALGLDKPVYLYRPKGMDGVGFDSLCKKWPPEWIAALEFILNEAQATAQKSPEGPD